MIVESKVILELKSVEHISAAHKKQLLTYLRLTGLKLGYLLNFGAALMRDGIIRTINGHLNPPPPCLRERMIVALLLATHLPRLLRPGRMGLVVSEYRLHWRP